MEILLANIAAQVVPAVASIFVGPQAGAAIKVAAGIVQQVTGTADHEKAASAIAANPDLETALRTALVSAFSSFTVDPAQLQAARDMTVRLGSKGGFMAYVPDLIGVLVVLLFASSIAFAMVHGVPGDLAPVVWSQIGLLGSFASAYIMFRFGSSGGSKDKDKALAAIAQAATAPAAQPVVVASPYPTLRAS